MMIVIHKKNADANNIPITRSLEKKLASEAIASDDEMGVVVVDSVARPLSIVGLAVTNVGLLLGAEVGVSTSMEIDGFVVGLLEGFVVGLSEGFLVGYSEGLVDGLAVGSCAESMVGSKLGGTV